jgi:hypothetical protein
VLELPSSVSFKSTLRVKAAGGSKEGLLPGMGMAHVLGFQLAKHLIKLRRTSPSNCDLLEPIRSILNGGNELTLKTF